MLWINVFLWVLKKCRIWKRYQNIFLKRKKKALVEAIKCNKIQCYINKAQRLKNKKYERGRKKRIVD